MNPSASIIGLGKESPKLTPRRKSLKKLSLQDVLKSMKNESSNEPIAYIASTIFRLFMFLHILKINNNDCYLKTSNIREKTLYMSETGKFKNAYSSFGNATVPRSLSRFSPKSIYQYDLIKESFVNCKNKGKLLVISLVIFTSKDSSHANLIIFNPYRNEVERFEPHGHKTMAHDFDSNNIDKTLQQLVDKLNNDLKLKLTYIPPHKVCPMIGFQKLEASSTPIPLTYYNTIISNDAGYCFAWSMFYANLRLKFPNENGTKLIKEAINIIGEGKQGNSKNGYEINPKMFKRFIRGQFKFLENEMNELNKYIPFRKYLLLYHKNRKDYLTEKEKEQYIIYNMITEQFIEKEFLKYS